MNFIHFVVLTVVYATIGSAATLSYAAEPDTKAQCQAPLLKEAQEILPVLTDALKVPPESLPAEQTIDTVKQRLIVMGKADQDIQQIAIRDIQTCKVKFGSPDMLEVMAYGRDISNTTRTELRKILTKTGWPVISIYGEEADKAAFLIVQHADRDTELQHMALQLLEPLARRGETDKENYALLFDRVRVNAGQAQRFGTQGSCKKHRWITDKTENPRGLDRRRASFNLPAMKEYVKQAQHMYCQ